MVDQLMIRKTSRVHTWLLIATTLLVLMLASPFVSLGLSPFALWAGLASAGAIGVYTYWPVASFRPSWLIPVYIVGQFGCWALIWQHSTPGLALMSYAAWLLPCWIVSALLLFATRKWVAVR